MDRQDERDERDAKPEAPESDKPKRFQIIRLEERIAPKAGSATGNGPGWSHKCRPSW